MQAIRYETHVADDHCIHFPTPDLPTGTVVELIALIKETAPHAVQQPRDDWSKMLGKYARFDSLEEVNDYVKQLREDRDVV